ncbi:MAG TPA: hypothetical protein VGH28_33515 [Polyangiaceae bacterium]
MAAPRREWNVEAPGKFVAFLSDDVNRARRSPHDGANQSALDDRKLARSEDDEVRFEVRRDLKQLLRNRTGRDVRRERLVRRGRRRALDMNQVELALIGRRETSRRCDDVRCASIAVDAGRTRCEWRATSMCPL